MLAADAEVNKQHQVESCKEKKYFGFIGQYRIFSVRYHSAKVNLHNIKGRHCAWEII